jgi:tetratricopeptide (TPR) repeat protein
VSQPKRGGELIEEAYKQGNWDLIISVADTMMGDDDPHNISIAYAEALAAKGNYEKAINVLNRKIAQKPEDYYLYQTKGNVFAVSEQYDSAIANYDIVIEMNPKYARTYINEGEIYEALGEKEKAIKKYMVATYLFARNNFEAEAREMERRILRLDPDYKDVKELMHDMGIE